MISTWQEFFEEEENLEIKEGDLTSVKCDEIMSPANSFGFYGWWCRLCNFDEIGLEPSI